MSDVTRTPHTDTATVALPEDGRAAVDDTLVEEDLLVEEVSIDGMCGVY